MSLGETIYRLRTEKNLSQGDLAEMLEVSRQSISKWENNSAVPDLEKIIKLSEIFEVSLDELVKGEEAPRRTETVNNISQKKVKEAGFPPRKIAGTILFCMAFAWFAVISLAVMIIVTVGRFGKEPFDTEQKGRRKLIVALVFTSRFIKMKKQK